MIKRLIFDIDGTLISGVDFKKYINLAFEDIGYKASIEDLRNIQKAITANESEALKFQKEIILEYFNSYSKLNLGIEYVDYLIDRLYHALPDNLEDGIVETLDYLKEKYSLVILTNWFERSQIARLENAGLLKYFEHVYGGEKYKKPSKEAYYQACGEYLPNESVMIGDSYIYDYKGAKDAGLYAILLDKEDEYKNIFSKVEKIKELKIVL